MFYVLAVSGTLYHVVLVLQVQYMTDFKSGEKLAYSTVCGLMDYRCMIRIIE
jgi:putative transposase